MVFFFQKLFWPTVRKNYSSVQGKLLIIKAEGQEFAIFFISLDRSLFLEQCSASSVVQFLKQNTFLTGSWTNLRPNTLE